MHNRRFIPLPLQDTPITEQQHREFYEKDHVTGAFASYFCDSVSLIVLCLPAFVIIDLLLKDKRCKMNTLIYPRTESSQQNSWLSVCKQALSSFLDVIIFILSIPIANVTNLYYNKKKEFWRCSVKESRGKP